MPARPRRPSLRTVAVVIVFLPLGCAANLLIACWAVRDYERQMHEYAMRDLGAFGTTRPMEDLRGPKGTRWPIAVPSTWATSPTFVLRERAPGWTETSAYSTLEHDFDFNLGRWPASSSTVPQVAGTMIGARQR